MYFTTEKMEGKLRRKWEKKISIQYLCCREAHLEKKK